MFPGKWLSRYPPLSSEIGEWISRSTAQKYLPILDGYIVREGGLDSEGPLCFYNILHELNLHVILICFTKSEIEIPVSAIQAHGDLRDGSHRTCVCRVGKPMQRNPRLGIERPCQTTWREMGAKGPWVSACRSFLSICLPGLYPIGQLVTVERLAHRGKVSKADSFARILNL